MEDYHKKFAALDERMKKDYAGFLDTCKNYMEIVKSDIMSNRVTNADLLGKFPPPTHSHPGSLRES